MTYGRTLLTALTLAAVQGLGGIASAGQLLTVDADKSQMLTVNATPGAVIIGNPSIADVTLQGNKVFVHGRNYGETNLVILDIEGQQIANFDVVTRQMAESSLVVYKAGERQSMTCAPTCEAQLQVGDTQRYFSSILEETKNKMELATGSSSAEATAPQAPQ